MKKFLPVFLLALLMVPLIASAQATQIEATICNILQVVKNIVAAIGLAIAVIIIIVGGIKYMTAGGDEEKTSSAKKAIINGIIGLIIVIGALFILALAQNFIVGIGGVNMLGNPCTGYVVP